MNCYSDLVRHALQKGIKPINAYVSDVSEHTALVNQRFTAIIGTSEGIILRRDVPAFLTTSGLLWDFAIPLLPDGTPLRINQFIKSQGINT